MYRGLNAGFGSPLENELPMLAYLGVDMARQDLQSHLVTGSVVPLIQEFTRTNIQPLFIVDRLSTLSLIPDECWVELMNEPDLKMTPEHYAEFVTEAYQAHGDRLRLFAGSISNLAARPLTWLQTLLRLCPFVTQVSVHRYPEGVNFDQPHAGFSSRTDELRMLKAILNGRPYIVTEVGYHQAKRGWWIFSRRLSDWGQRECLRRELEFWEAGGAEATFFYQLNDGPKDTALDRYGLRDRWGRWKPSAFLFGR